MATQTSKGGAEPRRLVRDFCRAEGICTRCVCRWARAGCKMCVRCLDYAMTHRKSIGAQIARESEN